MNTTIYGWQLRRVAGPDVEPLSLEQARQQLKLDPDLTVENDLISDFIVTARERCESFTKRTFVESQWQLSLETFPASYGDCNSRIVLPMGPILAVLGVSYLDGQGNRVALQQGQWLEELAADPPFIVPPYGEFWPSGRITSGSVVVDYLAGYTSAGSPTDAANVPAAIRTTMRAIVSRWFEKRTETDIDDLLSAGLWHLRNPV